jgi:hypothetical protein
MANQKIGPGRRRVVAVAASPRQNATVILSALLVALLAMWPVAIPLRLAVRL